MSEPASRSEQLERVWDQQQLWSAAADLLQRRIVRARNASLVLAIVTAVLAVASGQMGPSSSLAVRVTVGTAAVTAAAATLARRRVDSETIGTWTRAREVSERLKREVYSYCAGVDPYGSPEAHKTLGARARRIVDDVADLQRHLLGVAPAGRPIPDVHDVGSYLSVRVEDQIERYYQPRAREYERRARRLRRAGDVLGLTAAVLAALTTITEVARLGEWVPVVTTIATSLTAHISAARYDESVVEYLRTAQRLAHLRDEYLDDPGADPSALVGACEDVIAGENRGWSARWSAVSGADHQRDG